MKIDYNKDYSSGDIENNIVNVVIEIPLGSTDKIEWNSKTYEMETDRQEPSEFKEPINYGFIPNTVGGDNDALDALVLSDIKLKTGSVIETKVIGVMKFYDENEIDDKIITVPLKCYDDVIIRSLADIPEQIIKQITDYFNHYKDFKESNLTKVVGWSDIIEAKKTIQIAIEKFNNK